MTERRSGAVRAMLLAERLRAARTHAGLSQCATAAQLGRPQSYVSRCESGARRVDVFELAEFARLYGRPLAYFIGNERGELRAGPARPHRPKSCEEHER